MALIRDFLIGGCSPTGNCAQIMYAIFRVGTGAGMAFLHGMGKVPPSEGFTGAIAGMGLPAPALWSWAVGLIELVGGLLIAIGLLTRASAMALGVVMLVAFFGVHGGQLSGENSGEMAFLYLLGSALISSFGSGKYGADAFLRR